MKARILAAALALSLGATIPAIASESHADEHHSGAFDADGRHLDHAGVRPLTLAEAVELIARTYPGRTIAAQADLTGGEGMHYHVDMKMPGGSVAKFDVHARTQRIYNRASPEAAPEGTISLADAVKKVQLQARGRVVAAEFDPEPKPHYHMSVQGRKGEVTRLDLDLESGQAVRHLPRS